MDEMNRNLSRHDDSAPKPPQNKQTRRHPGLWPFILIALGITFLLDNLGLSTWGVWNALEVWWPLILIVLGVDLLSHSQPWGRPLTLGLAALAVGFMVIWSFNQPATSGNSRIETVSQALTDARAEIELNPSVGRLEIGANTTGKLIDGTLELSGRDRLVREFGTRGAAQFVRLEAVTQGSFINLHGLSDLNNAGWKLGLSPKVLLILRIKTGVGSSSIDLTDLKVTEFVLESGVGRATVTLPSSGVVTARVESGVGETTVYIPAKMQARVRASSGVGTVRVNGDYRREGDVYTSSGFETASSRVELEVQGGVGRVTVEPSTR